MAGPFYNAIKGTTAGTPGTGAFTPNAASAGFLAWSTVPTGWIGLVRFEDGSAWELQYSYWNGATLSRSATAQFVASSSGSGLTLTSAATAAMVLDANEVGADFVGLPARGWLAAAASTTITSLGHPAPTGSGTAAGATLANTNYLTRQTRIQYTSATTAGALAGWSGSGSAFMTSNTSGMGGWQFNARFGASQLPTGPRLFVGVSSAAYVAGADPSALVGSLAALSKDVADTNLQFLTNSNAGSGTKIDTGIALAANGWYDLTLWSEPGSLTVKILLIRLDTGAIYYGSTSTDVPAADASLFQYCLGALGTATGTAIIFHPSHALHRMVT
jgi:hypothetical protein